MSSEKNSRRINLSFKISSPEQNQAFEILNNVSNKTEFITQLILQNKGIEYDAKGKTTKELIKEALIELLPTAQFQGLFPQQSIVTARPAPSVDAKAAEEMAELAATFDRPVVEGENENQHPLEANADSDTGDIEVVNGDMGIVVSEDFLDSMEDMLFPSSDGEESEEP